MIDHDLFSARTSISSILCLENPFSWCRLDIPSIHYDDVIMGAIASLITSLTIVYSTVYSDADQRKHQSSASLAFVWGIHRGPVNSPHKWPVTRKMFSFDDVIMIETKMVLFWWTFQHWSWTNSVCGQRWKLSQNKWRYFRFSDNIVAASLCIRDDLGMGSNIFRCCRTFYALRRFLYHIISPVLNGRLY